MPEKMVLQNYKIKWKKALGEKFGFVLILNDNIRDCSKLTILLNYFVLSAI